MYIKDNPIQPQWQALYFTDMHRYHTGRHPHLISPNSESRPVPLLRLNLRVEDAFDKYYHFVEQHDEFLAKINNEPLSKYIYTTTSIDAKEIFNAILDGKFPLTGDGYFQGIFTLTKRGHRYNIVPYMEEMDLLANNDK